MDFLSHITWFGFFLSYLYNMGFCFCVFMGCECRCFFCLFFFYSDFFFVLGFVLLSLLLFACLLSKEKEIKDTLEEPGKKKP